MEKKKIVYVLAVGKGYYLQSYSQGCAYCYAPLHIALPTTQEQWLREKEDLNEKCKRKAVEASPLFFEKEKNIKKYIEKNGTWDDFVAGSQDCIGKIKGFPKIEMVELYCRAQIV